MGGAVPGGGGGGSCSILSRHFLEPLLACLYTVLLRRSVSHAASAQTAMSNGTEMLCCDEQYTSFTSNVMCDSVHKNQQNDDNPLLRRSEPCSIGGRKNLPRARVKHGLLVCRRRFPVTLERHRFAIPGRDFPRMVGSKTTSKATRCLAGRRKGGQSNFSAQISTRVIAKTSPQLRNSVSNSQSRPRFRHAVSTPRNGE